MTEPPTHVDKANAGGPETASRAEPTKVAPWVRLLAAVAVASALALLGMLTYAFLTSESSGQSAGINVNTSGSLNRIGDQEAPNFSLTDLTTGEEIELTDYRGRLVVLNFWASWCPPCRDEAPRLEAFHQTRDPKEVVLIGVSVWDQEADAKAFIEEYGKTYPIGIDHGSSIAIDYGVFGIPETFFIGPDGTLLGRYTGPVESAEHIGEMTEELTR